MSSLPVVDSKRFDKLLKRLKPFFEEKFKTKQRLKGLQSFLEVSQELDEVRIFEDHYEMIFEVFFDAFNHRLGRIKERAVCLISSKDAINLFELTDILMKIVKYSHAKINNGWKRDKIYGILEMLTSRSNHVKLRQWGLQLTLRLLSTQDNTDSDIVRIYASAVSLEVFKHPSDVSDPGLYDTIGVDENGVLGEYKRKMAESSVIGWSAFRIANEPPVTDIDSISQATPTVIIPRDGNQLANNIELFGDILNYFSELCGEITKCGFSCNTINDILSALESNQGVALSRMWGIFRDSYLKYLFPASYRSIGLSNKNGEGFALCPLDLLNALIDFIGKITTYSKLSDALVTPQKDVQNAIMCVLLSKNPGNFELVHEMIRQAFLSQNISVATYILASWIASSHQEGHPFLKRLLIPKMITTPMSPVANNPTKSSSSLNSTPLTRSLPNLSVHEKVNDLLVNQMLRRYLKYYILSIYNGKRKDQEMQSFLLRETLHFYRFLVCEKLHFLDASTWSMIMTILLDLGLLLHHHNDLDDLGALVAETILITWIRGEVKIESAWRKLEQVLSKIITVSGVASSWANLMIQVSYIMSESIYGNGVNLISDNNIRQRRKTKKKDQNSSNSNLLNTQLSESFRKLVPVSISPSNRKSNDERTSETSKTTTKNSSTDEGLIDLGPINQIMADSIQFSQMKDLKDSFSKDSLWIWKNLISSIGKVHEIKDLEIHYVIMNCYVTVWGILEKIRSIQPFSSQTKIPSLFEFAGIIFRAVIMEPPFAKSTALAAACLGKLMCRHQDCGVDLVWFHLYYSYIIKLFKMPVDNVSLALLSNSSRLYSLYLNGVTITIPATMCMLANVCGMKGAPEAAVRAAITMIGSLLVYEKHYRPLLPIIQEKESTQEGEVAASTIIYNPQISDDASSVFKNLKFGLFNLIQTSLQFHSDTKNEDYCELLLWNLGILYLEESVVPSVKETENLQNDILYLLLEYVSSKALPLVSAASDSLSLLAENFHRVHIHDETLIHIIDRLAWGISENLSIDETVKRKDLTSITSICSLLFKCLVEWLIAVPTSVVTNPNIALRISEVIDEAIHVANQGMESIESEKEQSTDEDKEIIQTNKQEVNEIYKIYETLREAAENTLFHLTHHLDNYPPCLGPAVMNTNIPDSLMEDNSETHDCHYFSFNDSSVVAIIEKPKDNKICLLIRNMTGKYAWDMTPFYHEFEDELEGTHNCIPKVPIIMSKLTQNISHFSSFGSDSIESSSDKGTDPLEILLLRIQNEHPECLYQSCASEFGHKSKFQNLIEEYVNLEESTFSNRDKLESERPPKPSNRKSCSVEAARLFLAQTGQLYFDYLKGGKMAQLVKSPNLIRDIRGLDKKYSREVAKFALLYVAPGQEDECSILKNSRGSYQYDEFVASLGWQIHLNDHTGYTGGLDASMVNDGLAIYYCSSTAEMIFHDATRMPTDSNDAKQLKKKRHIGNDHVHIIWNEHVRDYRWDTIGGDFGNAQIVVTPLANGLYTIDIYRDDLVRPFGPLQSRSVVSKECLGSLIRCTAMNAYRNALCAGAPKGMEPHPYSIRKQLIELIHSRHKLQSDSYEKHMNTIISEYAEKRSSVAASLQ